jgi:AcrR family transcriptional regulator
LPERVSGRRRRRRISPRPQIDHIRRPQILEAAAKVIAERGVSGTRIADVAERAGTSPPAVLYWFGSKDRLLAEALTFEEERFYDALGELLEATTSPRERLRTLIASASGGSDWALWMELWTRALRDSELAEARRRLDDRWRGEIAAIIRDGQEQGEFGLIDAGDAAETMASMLDGLAVQVTLGDPSVDERRMRELSLRAAGLLLECELATDGPVAAEAAG